MRMIARLKETLTKTKSATYAALDVVAGAGFEPTAFGL
jgi:hypothetical protein